jgi:hypothetical protein
MAVVENIEFGIVIAKLWFNRGAFSGKSANQADLWF